MKIICIGRNYNDHIKEMANDKPTEPLFFLKPETAIIRNNLPFFIPEFSSEIHHEIELVIKICKLGKHIHPNFAHTYYDEIGLGIDFTARDVQNECIKKGLPWEKSKAFDGSAPIGDFINKNEISNLKDIDFRLEKNGKVVQQGNSKDMIFSFDEIICHVSKFVTLKIGDLIFTGTPSGVGPVNIGDTLMGYINDKKMIELKIK